MKIRYDKEADAAYIYIRSPISKGEVRRSERINGIIFDFDKRERLIGIEVLSASKTFPAYII
jgi:uncharacterized protein YuzE